MKVHFVVDGQASEALLRLLLGEQLKKVRAKFHVKAGKDAARPVARFLQQATDDPVVLIVDSNDPDPDRSREQERSYRSYLRMTSRGAPFDVVLWVPSVEALYFRNPDVARAVIGKNLDPAVLAAGTVAPKQVLGKVLGLKGPTLNGLLKRLSPSVIAILREEPELVQIQSFLQSLGKSQDRKAV